MAHILQTIFSNAVCWNKLIVFLFKFQISFPKVQLGISLYFFMLSLVPSTWTNVDPVLWWIMQRTIKVPATWFNSNTTRHLSWRWGDYSGSLFRFNSWNPVHWIMEYWQLEIWTSCIFSLIRPVSRDDLIYLGQGQGEKDACHFADGIFKCILMKQTHILIQISMNFVAENSTDIYKHWFR